MRENIDKKIIRSEGERQIRRFFHQRPCDYVIFSILRQSFQDKKCHAIQALSTLGSAGA